MVLSIVLASCGNPKKTSPKEVDGVETSDTIKEASEAAKEMSECV